MSDETPQICVQNDVRTWVFKKGTYHPLEVKAEHKTGLVWLPQGNIRGVEDVRKFREILDRIEEYLSGEISISSEPPQSPSEPFRGQGGPIPPGTLYGVSEVAPGAALPLSGPLAGLAYDVTAQVTPPEDAQAPAPPPPAPRGQRPPSFFGRTWNALKSWFVSSEDYSARYWVA